MILQIHQPAPFDPFAPPDDLLKYAREVIRAEASALHNVAGRLDQSFLDAVALIRAGLGRVVITGTGKSADVGRKIAGTLSSTGTRAYVLDATRAVHGDLGMVHPNDIALVLSHSGESAEIVNLLGPLGQLVSGVVALTGNREGTLARKADIALVYGPLDEVCPLRLAPSTSTTAMIAMGDALAFTLLQLRGFTREDFARYHPAGSLGQKLLKVENAMRHGHDIRVAPATHTVRQVFGEVQRRGRRTGAVMLTDESGRLCGLFTDSDLARLFEQRRDAALDRPIAEVMTPGPHFVVTVGARVGEAVEMMREHKISELPVVDGEHRPVGMVDVTDLLGVVPPAEERADVRVSVA
jgi:arabinose-5-phosphate isomerase